MNIETRIDERLWDGIRSSYENRNFTGAIQDSMYFLSNLIRERTGLEGDGVALVGQAFGGRNPLLKVNKLQTESEKNVQQGIDQLLRGLYQAIRNPRSHDKYLDTEEDAIAIILFINYVVKIIDKSKSPFISQVFITRVLDKDFVSEDRYAELLVAEIPPKKRMDIFYLIFERLSEGDGDKLRYFFKAFLSKLTEEEKQSIYREISNFLKHSDDSAAIRTIIKTFSGIWNSIEESARFRTENKLINSIKDGKWHSSKNKCTSGAFGTWAINITEHFILKEKLYWVLLNKLGSSDRGEQDYVFRFFSGSFRALTASPPSHLINLVISGMRKGDKRFKKMAEEDFFGLGEEWQEPFKQDILAFEESPLPFDPEYDELEIPF